METSLISVNSPGWQEALDRAAHDVYHLPGYARLSARTEGGEPVAFSATAGECLLLLPLILRSIRLPWAGNLVVTDAVSPYGYPGPICNLPGASDARAEEFLRSAFGALVRALRDRGVVTAFVRLHPLLTSAHGPLEDLGAVVPHGETVWVDLTASEAELQRQIRPGHRAEIDKLRAAGFVVDVAEQRERLPEFGRIYRETMDRVRAASTYYFSDEDLAALKDALGPRLHLLCARRGDDLASAALLTECCGIVQYHLAATPDRFLALHASKLVIAAAITWAKARGHRALHLGGGVGARPDSLFRFKAGFSPHRATFRTWRLVVDEETHAQLGRAWEQAAGRPVDPTDPYFPVYRRPFT